MTWLRSLSATRHFSTTRNIVGALLLLAPGACASHEAPAIPDTGNAISRAKTAYARGERVPAKADAGTAPMPGEGVPYPGSWTPTVAYRDSLFTIERPESSSVEPRSPDPTYGRPHRDVIIARLPECKWSCMVSIEVWQDSASDGVRAMVPALTAPDPDTTPGSRSGKKGEATIIDSLPLGPDAAVHLESACGDCTSRVILTSYHGWIARIEYTSDDREGYRPALTAQLRTIARSFRWRR